MMMIVGVSSKVVPTLSGVGLRKAASLWPVFILPNVGNLARVSSQIATDFKPAAYAVMGASGFIEVVGLAWWGGAKARRRPRSWTTFDEPLAPVAPEAIKGQ